MSHLQPSGEPGEQFEALPSSAAEVLDVLMRQRKESATKIDFSGENAVYNGLMKMLDELKTLPDNPALKGIRLKLEATLADKEREIFDQRFPKITKLEEAHLLAGQKLIDEIVAGERHADSVAVVYCDVNGLKSVNDGLGENTGTAYLEFFAETLQSSQVLKQLDADGIRVLVTSRGGGDEFDLLLSSIVPSVPLNGGQVAKAIEALHGEIDGRSKTDPKYADKFTFDREAATKLFYGKDKKYDELEQGQKDEIDKIVPPEGFMLPPTMATGIGKVQDVRSIEAKRHPLRFSAYADRAMAMFGLLRDAARTKGDKAKDIMKAGWKNGEPRMQTLRMLTLRTTSEKAQEAERAKVEVETRGNTYKTLMGQYGFNDRPAERRKA